MKADVKNTQSRVLETIVGRSLVDRDDKILVALSGGPDSVAMLHILHSLRHRLKVSLCALYINHLLRPRSARKEARFCAQLCEEMGIPAYYEEVDIKTFAEQEKAGIEEIARRYRYRVLDKIAVREGCRKIAVGHHRGDRIETILFNLFRGAGRSGLLGMPARRGIIIRPLYDLTRKQILDYLEVAKQEYMIDRSNLSRQFTRNRIRHDLITLIETKIVENASENILRWSEIMAEEEQYLEQEVARVYKKRRSLTPGGKIKLDLKSFLEYDLWLRRRLVRMLLGQAGELDIGFADIERTLALAAGPADSRLTISSDLMAEKYSDWLYVYKPGRKVEPLGINMPGQTRLEYPRVRLTVEFVGSFSVKEVQESRNAIAFVDYDKLAQRLHVAGYKPGARFHPYGRPGSKKVSDFLTDRKYPRPLRDELPVLYDKNGVVWLAGVEIDDRVKVDAQTKKTVKLKIEYS